MRPPRTGDALSRAALVKATRPLERTVHIDILRWLRANVSDVVFHPHNAGLARDGRGGARQKAEGVMAGVSDLVGIVEYGPHAGRLFAVEVKRPRWTGSEVRPEQWRFLDQIRERGGLGTVAGSAWEVECWARNHDIIRPRGWISPWNKPLTDRDDAELHRL